MNHEGMETARGAKGAKGAKTENHKKETTMATKNTKNAKLTGPKAPVFFVTLVFFVANAFYIPLWCKP
jgi:hypothetical protein